MDEPRISVLGTSGLLLEAPGELSVAVQQRIWGLAEQVRTWPGVREVVPGMTNLLLLFADLPRDPAVVARRLRAAWDTAPARRQDGRRFEVPVVYGGAAGIDLPELADRLGLAPREIIDRHCGRDYTVFAVGSHPGFCYLGTLDKRLFVPRRAEPRLEMSRGAVTLAGWQTGVTVSPGPSGWHVIGVTHFVFFDPTATPPASIRPGDVVRFVPERVLM
jgi:KipI family sensor histidine kinase inhibitor